MLAGARTPEASDWVRRFAHLIRPGGVALDLACGSGRHTRFLLARGLSVVALDRDVSALEAHPRLRARRADLEGEPWPLSRERFDAVVVTNYLWRPLFPHLIAALAPDGVLLYETFAVENLVFGRPRRREFLLEPGELLERFAGELRVVAYEHGALSEPHPRCVQRIAAVGRERALEACALFAAAGA